MIEDIFKKLKIKTKPEKFFTYLFYGLTFLIITFIAVRFLLFFTGDGHLKNSISPYTYFLWILCPTLAYSFYVNSGIPKNDGQKLHAYIKSNILFSIIVGSMICTWINNVIWFLLKKLPNYDSVMAQFPQYFPPALKTLSFILPFIGIFKMIDYFLDIVTDDDFPKAIGNFKGISLKKKVKINEQFTCSNIICHEKGTNKAIIVPEKKRYEASLVQGATGTGKTAMVLLPMSANDLEKKFFFREYSKKIGYSLLKRDLAYIVGPYDNQYMNSNFSLNLLKPRKGFESIFLNEVKDILQYNDKETGNLYYKNLGITIVENDGKFISDFTKVANNFDIPVLAVDPGKPETTLSINPFAIEDPTKVASIIADVLKSMYEDQGGGGAGDPFFTQVTIDAFQNLAILLKEMYPILNNGEVASLEDMLELLYNFDKVEEMTEELKKIPELESKYKLLISYFEKNFYKPSLNINGFEIPGTRGSGRKETEKFLYGAITQLNNLIRHPGLKKALCGKTNILNFDSALENGNVITACSRKGELGIIQSKAFGMFFIMQFQDAVLRRKGTEDTRTPHFLYIDEFPEYINKDMDVMFTLFRKYRCGVTIAIQNLSQLEKSGKAHYRQTVLANTKTQIVFGDTVPEDSKYWSEAFGKDKIPDPSRKFEITAKGEVIGKPQLEVKEKERAKGYKIQNQGFGEVMFITKDANGKTYFGKGKVKFLDARFNSPHPIEKLNFEKYLMSKPMSSPISYNEVDDNESDIVSTTPSTSNLSHTVKEERYANSTTREPLKFDPNSIDIVFEDELEPTLDNSKVDGGAITETYETPVIKHKK